MMTSSALSLLIFLALFGIPISSQAAGSEAANSGFKEIPSAPEKEVPAGKAGKEAAKEKTVTAPEATQDTAQKEISATVRIIRSNPETEVFFKDYKDSLIIPRNSRHNSIYEACEESRKKGTAVKLVVDSKSRQILSLPDSKQKTSSPESEKTPDTAQ